MKVILKRDVRGVGREGELKEVKDGYARNYLIPHAAAVIADRSAMADWERTRSKREERDRQLRAESEQIAARLNELVLTTRVKAGEKDRLFGSVTNRDVAVLIRDAGIEVDRHEVHLREPIKTVGTHRVPIHLATGVVAQVTVQVEPDRVEVPARPERPSGRRRSRG